MVTGFACAVLPDWRLKLIINCCERKIKIAAFTLFEFISATHAGSRSSSGVIDIGFAVTLHWSAKFYLVQMQFARVHELSSNRFPNCTAAGESFTSAIKSSSFVHATDRQ